MYVVIGFKSIIVMKGCVTSDLRYEMIVRPLDQVTGRDNFGFVIEPSTYPSRSKEWRMVSNCFFQIR